MATLSSLIEAPADADWAVRLESIGKRFEIGAAQQRPSLLQTARRWLTGSVEKRELWALRGVDLEVRRGEILGLIGPNGAGKSTILLLTARILVPTEGSISLRGRTNPFFQLSAGLQPELTVRENFSLCAALLGIPRADYRRHFDRIVEFAELRPYLNARLAELSTGLAARVPFSTAVHADLDILLVDEMLSVGDAAFQAKCRDVFMRFKRQGKTLLIVSHNLDLIRTLCDRCLYLSDGRVRYLGEPDEAVRRLAKDLQVGHESPAGPPQERPSLPMGNDRLDKVESSLRNIEALLRQRSLEGMLPPQLNPARVSPTHYAETLTVAADQWKRTLGHDGPLTLVDNSTSGAWLAMALLGSSAMERPLVEGDEIITSAIAYPGVAQAAALHGWRLIAADVDASSFNLTPQAVERALTPRTRAVVVCHLAGGFADIDALLSLCRRKGLVLVEMSGTLGSTRDGRVLGSSGDIGVISILEAPNWAIVQAKRPEFGTLFSEMIESDPRFWNRCRILVESLGRRPWANPVGISAALQALHRRDPRGRGPLLRAYEQALAEIPRWGRISFSPELRTFPHRWSAVLLEDNRPGGPEALIASLAREGVNAHRYGSLAWWTPSREAVGLYPHARALLERAIKIQLPSADELDRWLKVLHGLSGPS